jgi:hypothetical protein
MNAMTDDKASRDSARGPARAGDPRRLFEPAVGLTPEWLAYLKAFPLTGQRLDLNDGQTVHIDARQSNGVDVIKYNDIFVAPTANVIFGPQNLRSGFPRAFFILCKRMIFRPRVDTPNFTFVFAQPQGRPPTPPTPQYIGGHSGIDGTAGIHGHPTPDLSAVEGPPIYILFNDVQFQTADDNLRLADITARGPTGQPGGNGGDGGGCTGGPCKNHPGVGGTGGDGGDGFGGGVVFLYAPAVPLDKFYLRLAFHCEPGQGADEGTGGLSSAIDGGFGGTDTYVRAPAGKRGSDGKAGNVSPNEKNDVLSLFL